MSNNIAVFIFQKYVNAGLGSNLKEATIKLTDSRVINMPSRTKRVRVCL